MRRVVVTGMGMVTPLGDGVDTNWRRLMAAESGIRSIQAFDTSDLRDQDRRRGAARRQGRTATSTPTATWRPRTSASSTSSSSSAWPRPTQAVEDSGWKPHDEEGLDRTGVMIGSGIGGLQTIYETSLVLKEQGTAPRQPVLHPLGADQSRLGPGLDQVRLQGPEPRRGHGLRHRRPRASATRRA